MLQNENVSPEPPTSRSLSLTIAKVIGFLLLLGTGFFYLASGLLVPFPYLYLMWGLWIAIVGFTIVKRDDWRIVVAAPFVSGALWFAILTAGERFLNWTG